MAQCFKISQCLLSCSTNMVPYHEMSDSIKLGMGNKTIVMCITDKHIYSKKKIDKINVYVNVFALHANL